MRRGRRLLQHDVRVGAADAKGADARPPHLARGEGAEGGGDAEGPGLEVDRLGDRLDVMLKPPEGLLAGVPGIDGTTLLGDGRVLIVLDLHEILSNGAG